jgi:hypothetical protein
MRGRMEADAEFNRESVVFFRVKNGYPAGLLILFDVWFF